MVIQFCHSSAFIRRESYRTGIIKFIYISYYSTPKLKIYLIVTLQHDRWALAFFKGRGTTVLTVIALALQKEAARKNCIGEIADLTPFSHDT
jgi:hypothetical protein